MTDSHRDPTTGQDWAESRPAPTRPAATVIVGRDGPGGLEVLMVRRRSGGTFGGLWVFPGGRVDPADYTTAGVAEGDELTPPEEIAVARVAAVREAAEEASLHLDADRLVAHSHWMPPAEAGRRYATWFFVTAAPPDADVTVDRTEVREHRWVRPAAALVARDAGSFPLAAPTWMTLWQLAPYRSVGALVAGVGVPHRFETRMYPHAGGMVFMWPGDAGYDDGDVDRAGDRLRLIAPEAEPWRVEVVPAEQLSGGA